ncbi:hypothetical protein Q5P01_010803 [Channa striata]|uniref:Dynein regulatory complex protein 9 n=1 Tax=Channa striata TaxID=64152 RepID=A0AA88MT60_CHASR|nr:hypothetical protein Q5P01_010803 [Channa striata]
MSLSLIQSLRVSAVLEDCLNQLDILAHTLRVQISRERGTAPAQEIVRLTKLRGDCQYILQLFFKLHLELKEKHSFNSLLDVIKEEEQKKMHENMRRQEEIELKLRKQNLQIRKEELQQKTEQLKDLKGQHRELRQQLKEHSKKIAERKKNAKKDIELLLQLTQKETSKAEKMMEDQLELLQQQLKEEMRVHEESEKFMLNQQEELQEQLQQWEEFTKQMMQEREQQLNSVCNKRIINENKQSEMRRKFIEMEQVVMEDREEQEKLRQQQEQVRAATKLQAWWRGCMVRRGLCTVKKANEAKKGKKKEGQKKKK